MLQLHILPETGGDTMFSNMYAAYDALTNHYKNILQGLIGIHESEHLYEGRYSDRGQDDNQILMPTAKHPIVRTHPETGKKALYVNRTFTKSIEGMNDEESSSITNKRLELENLLEVEQQKLYRVNAFLNEFSQKIKKIDRIIRGRFSEKLFSIGCLLYTSPSPRD